MGIIERHSPERWQATADAMLASQSGAETTTASDGATNAKRGVNANGAPLLGDSRDLVRPKTSDIPAEPGVYKWRDG